MYNICSFLSQRVQSYPKVHGVAIYSAESTFSRYLTGDSPDASYLRKAESHAEVAVACLTYLSFQYFDDDITDEEVDGIICRGGYVLRQYSQSNFLYHLRDACRDVGSADEILRASAREFLKARWNLSFRHVDSEPPARSSAVGHIRSMDPEDYKKLNIIAANLRLHIPTESTNGLFFLCTRVTDC